MYGEIYNIYLKHQTEHIYLFLCLGIYKNVNIKLSTAYICLLRKCQENLRSNFAIKNTI